MSYKLYHRPFYVLNLLYKIVNNNHYVYNTIKCNNCKYIVEVMISIYKKNRKIDVLPSNGELVC